jgi:hypothetical protein
VKIVNLDQFIALPAGTVFAKYQPCVFDDLCIKGDSILQTKDFFYQQIVDAIDSTGSDDFSRQLFEAEETGKSLKMDFHCEGRDGCFEPGQLFAVWEPDDVLALIARLQVTVPAEHE